MKQMPKSNTENLKQTIRAAGLRATQARIATLDFVGRAASPMTHADVAEHLAEKGFDQATAYRNLIALTDAELLRRSEMSDHVWRFEPIEEGEHAHGTHPHLVCVDCGGVSCLSEVKLTKKSLAACKQIGEVSEILVRGLCKNCN